MTDDTPTIPRAIVCPVDDCAVMIPDTVETKARHRRGHEHRDKVDDAIRRGLRTLSSRLDTLEGARKEDLREVYELIAGIERLVQGIEVPEQLPQLQITTPNGWDDNDDLEPDTIGARIDDDWDALTAPAAPTEPDEAPAGAPETNETAADSLDDIPTALSGSWRAR